MFQERTEAVSLYIQIENALQRFFFGLNYSLHNYFKTVHLLIQIVFETMIMGCK